MSRQNILFLFVATVAATYLGAVVAQTTIPSLGDYQTCGSSSKIAARIVGGAPADRSSYKWMAALLRKINPNLPSSGYYQFCGGSLITRRHILTAAHCLPGVQASWLKARLGEYNLNVAETGTVEIGISHIRSHPGYNPSTMVNDIAILRLSTAVTYGTYIQSICLPPPVKTYAGYTGWIAGWGSTVSGGSGSSILMEVSVLIWAQADCNNPTMSDTGTLPDSTMCAGERAGGKDTCQGDSGGPLMVIRSDGRWEIVGITSWGNGCALPNSPGVYTRVNSFLLWIAGRIGDV